jgi:hypothetical protein
MRLRSVVLSSALVIVAAPCGAQTIAQRLEQARAHIEDVKAELAKPLLEGVLRQAATARERLRAYTLLGIAELNMANRPAARLAFDQALRIDPALRVDSLAYLDNNLILDFEDARRIFAASRPAAPVVEPAPRPALALAVHVPNDTTLAFDAPRFVIGVEPNAHARVIATIAPAASPERVIWADTQMVQTRQSIAWQMRLAPGEGSAGAYLLRVQGSDSLRQAPAIVRTLRVTRASVDTQPHPAPLTATAFAPESATVNGRGPRARMLLAGASLALAAVAGPMVLGNTDLNSGLSADPTAYAVAGGVAIASIVSFVKARQPSTTQVLIANVEQNRRTREEDQRKRDDIVRANAAALARAGIRVTVDPVP